MNCYEIVTGEFVSTTTAICRAHTTPSFRYLTVAAFYIAACGWCDPGRHFSLMDGETERSLSDELRLRGNRRPPCVIAIIARAPFRLQPAARCPFLSIFFVSPAEPNSRRSFKLTSQLVLKWLPRDHCRCLTPPQRSPFSRKRSSSKSIIAGLTQWAVVRPSCAPSSVVQAFRPCNLLQQISRSSGDACPTATSALTSSLFSPFQYRSGVHPYRGRLFSGRLPKCSFAHLLIRWGARAAFSESEIAYRACRKSPPASMMQ